MSQPQPSKNQKQRRNRTNSEGHNQNQNQRRGQGQGGSGGGGGFTKVFANSNSNAGTRELQSLLNTLPNSTSSPRTPHQQQQFLFDGANNKSGSSGYQGQSQGQGRRRGNSYSNNYNNGTSGGGDGGQNLDNREDFDIANNEDAESIRLNSSALRRIDKDFAKLHGTASQVAVYRYNPATKSWDKTDTVGCLFLYERSVGAKYGLVVMNRKNANNFIQCFGSDGQVVLQTPYLLLKSGEDIREDVGDGSQVIHCIWFYDIQDCYSSASILKQMGLKFEGEMGGGDGAPAQGGMMGGGSANPGGGGGTPMVGAGNALFQMLQKESPTPQMKMKGGVMTAEELESQMLDEAPPEAVAVTAPSSVFQQFVNLSVKGNGLAEVVAPTTTTTSESTLSPLTISQNKMRTVEQLERQMKQRRPQPVPVPTNNFPDPTAAIQNELIQTLGIGNSITKTGSPSLSTTTLPSVMAQNMELGGQKSKVTLLANVIGKCVDDVDPEDLRKLLEVMDPSDLVLVTVPGPAGEVGEPKLIWKLRQRPSSQGQHTNGSTTSSFTTPTGEFLSANGTRSNSQLGPGPSLRPSVLAKEQMQKALIHLIQTDDGFLTQIHDAYVRTVELRYQQQQQPY